MDNFDNFIEALYSDKAAKELSKGRKCPFRKCYYAVLNGKNIQINLRQNYLCDYIEEEFQDCIGKECAKWSPVGCSA